MSKEIYKHLDELVEAYKDGNHPFGKTGVDFEAFKYVNGLKSKDAHLYLKYYFERAKRD